MSYFEDEKNHLNFPIRYHKNLIKLLLEAQDITERYIGRFNDFNQWSRYLSYKEFLFYFQHIIN